MANAFLEAFNRAYGANFSSLSDQEILAEAGIPNPNPGGNPTYFDINSYVIDPTHNACRGFNTTRMILEFCGKMINACHINTYDAGHVRGKVQFYAF